MAAAAAQEEDGQGDHSDCDDKGQNEKDRDPGARGPGRDVSDQGNYQLDPSIE